MHTRFDWKFLLTLAITIASVGVPVWLWQVDLSSKALSLTIKSTAELQPKGVDALDGIQLSIDGKPLEFPYVSVLELSNSGSKPIVTSDFEGPIRILSAKPSKIVKIRTTSSTPNSLEPSLSLADDAILLQPLLLNPGDTIRFTTVVANTRPVFSARARVAGIADISISDAQTGKAERKYWLGLVVSMPLLALYIINFTEFALLGLRRRVFLFRSLMTGIASGIGSAVLFAILSTEQPAAPSKFIPVMAAAVVLSLPFFYRLYRRMRSGAA